MKDLKTNIFLQIFTFLLLCWILTFALSGLMTGIGDGFSYSDLSQLSPGLAVALIYYFFIKVLPDQKNYLGLTLKGFPHWLYMPVLMFVLYGICFMLSLAFQNQTILDNLYIRKFLEEQGFYWGGLALGTIALSAINIFLGTLINIPFFLAEELGWRAFLQEKLLRTVHPVLAFVAGGVLWGSWKALVLFSSGSDLVNNMSVYVEILALCIPIGVIFMYVYRKSGSILASALTHGALSQTAMTATLFSSVEKPTWDYTGPAGMVMIPLFWILAIILYKNINWLNHLN